MKSKKITLIFGICLALVLVMSLILAACAPEAAAPGAPTRISPQLPTPTTPAPAAPAPAKPAPATPAPAPAAEVLKWKVQTIYPAGDPMQAKMWTDICNNVNVLSDGRLEWELYAVSVLVPPLELTDAVGMGTVEVGGNSAAYNKGMMPETNIESFLPQTFREAWEPYYVYWDLGLEELFKESYAKFNNYHVTNFPRAGITAVFIHEVPSAADIAGMKIRTHGMGATWFEAMGASTGYIPGGEIYTALQLGTFEGATWAGPSSFYGFNWYEVAEYVMYPFMSGPCVPDTAQINLDSWNALAPDLQAIIITEAKRASQAYMRFELIDNEESMKKMEAEGMKRTEWGPDSIALMVAAAEPVWNDAAALSPECYQAVKIITDFCREVRGYTDYKLD